MVPTSTSTAKQTEPDTLPAGHETAGEIVEVVEAVSPSMVGQRVAVEVIGHGKACLTCWYCRLGQYRNCTDQGDYAGGGFAEYVTRKAAGCYPLSDSLTWEEGALVEPLAVSIQGFAPGPASARRHGGSARRRQNRSHRDRAVQGHGSRQDHRYREAPPSSVACERLDADFVVAPDDAGR